MPICIVITDARFTVAALGKKCDTLLDLCVSSLRRGHANLLCIVPILTDVPRKESEGGSGHEPNEAIYREARAKGGHRAKANDLPVIVWFSCLENHLCQVELIAERKGKRNSAKNILHFSICACHPCAGAMLIFSVSFQF